MLNWLKRTFGQNDSQPKVRTSERLPLGALGEHLLQMRDGDTAMEAGNFSLAAEHYQKALEFSPCEAPLAARLAFALKELNQLEEAERYAQKALSLAPSNVDAHYLLALLAVSRGQAESAISSFRAALQIAPYFVPACAGYARLLCGLGRLPEAIEVLDNGLAHAPDQAELHGLRGNLACTDNQFDAARMHFQRAAALEPLNAEYLFGLGNVCYSQGMVEEATAHYRAMLALNPDDVNANFHLGIVFNDSQNYDAAIAYYERALGADPDRVDIRINLGNSLKDRGSYVAAIAAYEQALSQSPDNMTIHYNMGMLFQAERRLDLASAAYEAALAVAHLPANAHAYSELALQMHINLGAAYLDQYRFAEAMVCFDSAVALDPQSADARSNRGMLALLLGQFESGWADYEYRHLRKGEIVRNGLAETAWLNDADLAGKILLIYADQGMGDAIQFSRYVSMFASLGAITYLEVHAPLQPLMTQFLGAGRVFSHGDALPYCDYQCAISSLPLAFQTRLESIPNAASYLAAPLEKVAAFGNELRQRFSVDVPRIGLVWAGNPLFKNDHNRSIPQERLTPLLLLEQYNFFLLQKESGEGILQQSATNVCNLGHRLNDFSDTAGIIANLDLVITVDTSVAHLAGAMGKPVWILLPFIPDFRWMLDRNDSPWYPSARLFRQTKAGNWSSVIDAVVKALGEEFAAAHE